jgi:hypothetical protein
MKKLTAMISTKYARMPQPPVGIANAAMRDQLRQPAAARLGVLNLCGAPWQDDKRN